jgi:hypothetical protein
LYLFRLRQKRIPLLSLALLNAHGALSLGVSLRETPGNFPPFRGFDFAGGVWDKAPNPENQNAQHFGSPFDIPQGIPLSSCHGG